MADILKHSDSTEPALRISRFDTHADHKAAVENNIITGEEVVSVSEPAQREITASAPLSADLVADGTDNKVFTAAERTKLAGLTGSPGSLDTTSASALATSGAEAMTGNIRLHKVSKTGSFGDLLNAPKPTIARPSYSQTIGSGNYYPVALYDNAGGSSSSRTSLNTYRYIGTPAALFHLYGWYSGLPEAIGTGMVRYAVLRADDVYNHSVYRQTLHYNYQTFVRYVNASGTPLTSNLSRAV